MKSRKPPSIDYNIIIGKCNIVIPRRTDTSIARRARPRLFSTMYRICGSANSLTNCSVEVSLGALSTTITSNVAKSNWSNASRHSRKSCARSRVQTTTEVGATGTWDAAGSGTGSDTTARHSSSLLTVESRYWDFHEPSYSVEVPYQQTRFRVSTSILKNNVFTGVRHDEVGRTDPHRVPVVALEGLRLRHWGTQFVRAHVGPCI